MTLSQDYHRSMEQRMPRSRTRRIARSRPPWLILAIGSSVAATAAGIYLFGRITELQEASAQPSLWHDFATETTVRHWTGIAMLCEIAALVCWFLFARAWVRTTPQGSAALRYSVSIAAAVLGPWLLLAIFALL